jgi:hypothetical protein
MMAWCPPLFDDNPRRATKRLFLYASGAIADMLRKKFKIAGYVTEDYEYMAHMAWLIGGTSAAQALIREVDCIKSAWGRGDEQKALFLTKVCTAHMISVWFGGIERQPEIDGDARRGVYENSASSMLSVINKFLCTGASEISAMTAQDVKDATNMDRQWNWENESGGQPLTYAGLLLARALEACGQRCLEWSRVIFPVESVKQLHDGGAILEPRRLQDADTFAKVLASMDEGVRAVKRYHHMNIEGRLQTPEGR